MLGNLHFAPSHRLGWTHVDGSHSGDLEWGFSLLLLPLQQLTGLATSYVGSQRVEYVWNLDEKLTSFGSSILR